MSVHRRERANGRTVWQVTWRDPDRRQRAETFPTRQQAEQRERELEDLRWQDRIGDADAGRETLRDATEIWWTEHVETRLADQTIDNYARALDKHLLPRLGAVPIRDITPARVLALQAELNQDGIGDAMSHRVLMLLSGILRHAVLRGRIDANPVAPVRVPQLRRRRVVRPLAPATVERIRAALLDTGDHPSATIVSVMAYAGLRPGEALALTWRDLGERTLLVERTADGHGGSKETKTKTFRTVRLLAPLAEDLASWRAHSTADAAETAAIFPRDDGQVMTDTDYRNWRRRQFATALRAADVERCVPYDLRHSFASLMIQAGYSAAELAAEMGHAPTLTLDTYAHLFSEFARGERVDPVEAITQARMP